MNVQSPQNLRQSRLARFGVAMVVAGFFIFLIGIFPQVIALALTQGLGVLQIAVFLFGLGLIQLGSYVYLYATRHRAIEPTLREDIGKRLVATGYVLAVASGLADVLGIGSHLGLERPFIGPFQASGVVLGVLISIFGLFLYSSRQRG